LSVTGRPGEKIRTTCGSKSCAGRSEIDEHHVVKISTDAAIHLGVLFGAGQVTTSVAGS
jgi:hypothetical protein